MNDDTMEKPFFVVSDVHLGAVPASTETSFRRFLDYTRENASGLLINGDLFEFGIAYRTVIPIKHYRVLAKLADLVEAGVPVFFTGGNHDHVEWGGHALEAAGVMLLEDLSVMDWAGWRALITHGDSACSGRPAIERRLSRSRLIAAILRGIHPDLIARIQPYTTSTRRQVRLLVEGGGGGPKHHADEIQEWALRRLHADSSLDLVIAGHSHLPAKVSVEPGRYYLNSGDWISNMTYIVLPVEDSPPLILRWGAEGPLKRL